MLELMGARFSCCDGLSRRSFLHLGFLGLGGLTLPQFLGLRRASAAGAKSQETHASDAAVIFIELAGGAQPVRDLRPQARCAH